MRQKDTAYILWCCSFFGVSGLHRFYLGKPISGVLYLCTWGFFGIGQFIDLFLIPGIVERANVKEQQLLASSPPPFPSTPPPPPKRLDIEILKLCRDRNGATLSDCVIDTSASPKEVKKVIHELCVDELLIIDNRESDGAVIYRPI